MQLADDHALGSINNEGAVLRHQRNVAEENFLLFNIANRTIAGLSVFVENRQAHRDLKRRGVSHAALFALSHVILQLQAHGIAALIAEVWSVRVVSAAFVAEHIARMKRVGDDSRSAILASGAQVMQALKVSALALPVADCIINELKLRDVAEIGDRKHRLKYRLQSAVVAFAGQAVHLQEALVGTLLYFNQVWNLDGCWNLGKIKTMTESVLF